MAKYSNAEFIGALGKSVFGLVLAIAMGIVFESFFLGLITAAFFIFLPMQDEDQEEGMNALGFACVMVLILFLAGLDAPWGLGFEVGGAFATSTTWKWILLPLFGIAFIASVPTRLDKWMSLGEVKIFGWMLLLATVAGIVFILQPWTWASVAVVFTGFWIIATLGGAGGDASSRNVLGVIFVTMAIVVFAGQAGTQVVGGLAFGEWWPTMAQTGSNVFGPISETFTQLSGSLGLGLQLLINPTGFAQNIMQGQYTRDSTTGLAGAFGLEIEELKTTPIYVDQPYTVMFNVKNRGSYDAENIQLSLSIGEKAPSKTEWEFKKQPIWEKKFGKNFVVGTPFPVPTYVPISINKLGFSSIMKKVGEKEEWTQMCPSPDGKMCYKFIGDMTQLDIRQEFFQSSGTTCKNVVDHNMLKEFMPLIGHVKYDYKIASSLDMEFMSSTEWGRLVRAGELATQRKKPATLSNAPVRLNIDALEQPIREGTPFFIGLQVISAQTNGVVRNPIIEFNIPAELADNLDVNTCTVKPTTASPKEKPEKLIWDFTNKPEPYIILCQFRAVDQDDLKDNPTKTFLFTASASYTFIKSKPFLTKIEFGGIVCCDEESDCARYKQTCDTTINKCGKQAAVAPEPGKAGYCAHKGSCSLGDGGCSKPEECNPVPMFSYKAPPNLQPKNLECRDAEGLDVKVCCWIGSKPGECRAAYDYRMDGIEPSAIYQQMTDNNKWE